MKRGEHDDHGDTGAESGGHQRRLAVSSKWWHKIDHSDEVVPTIFQGKGHAHEIQRDARMKKVETVEARAHWWRRNWPVKDGGHRGER